MRRRVALASLGLLMAVSLYVLACNRAVLYRGDGDFRDAGVDTAVNRYVLDLGLVELWTGGEHTFRLSGLPPTELTVGFQTGPTMSQERVWETKPLDAVVRLRVARADGSAVIDQTGRVSDWIWSTEGSGPESFVYVRGQREEIRLRNGNTTSRRLGEGQDGGWGTSFSPGLFQQYDLSLSVLVPCSDRRAVRLVTKGGGWK